MTPLEPWRQALRSLIPRGFLQRDRAADGLFISDYPCHCADAAAVDAALQAAGFNALVFHYSGCFQVTAAGRLRRIDGAPEAYRQLIAALPDVSLPAPTDENLYLWSLARRLLQGEGDPARQPIPPLRLTLKCLDGADTDALIRLLPPLLALHQRRGEPLPRSAGMLIAGYLKGETPC